MIYSKRLILGAVFSSCISTAIFTLAIQAQPHVDCEGGDGCVPSTWLCQPGGCYRGNIRSADSQLLISPIADSSIRSTRPTVRWRPVSNTDSYIVEIWDASDTLVFSKSVDADITELPFPPETRELDRNRTYTVNVITTGSPSTQIQGDFFVISQADLRALEATEQDLTVLERVALYQNTPPGLSIPLPLYTDAIELLEAELEQEPQNFSYALRLGGIYLEAMLVEAAEQQYREILSRADNTVIRAQARVGLAQVALNRDEAEVALELLQQALNEFQSVNESFFIAQTLQFIAETYANSDDPTSAQQFYIQALDVYEELEPTENLPQTELNRFINVIREEIQ